MESRNRVNGIEKGTGKGMRRGKGRKKRRKIDIWKVREMARLCMVMVVRIVGGSQKFKGTPTWLISTFLQQHPGLVKQRQTVTNIWPD